MSKVVAVFDTENAAFQALEGVEDYEAGAGQVLPRVPDPTQAVGSELFLSGREAARTAFGTGVGALLAVLLVHLHRAGLVTFSLLSPAFAGGTLPVYLAAALVGAALGAFICSLSAMAQVYETAGPEPSILVVYTLRRKLPDVRSIVQQHGGQLG